MFFEQIDRMMGRDADLILTIRKTDDGTLTVAAHTRMNGVEDEARHYIAPFTASGTPQELDTGFIPALAEPAVKTQGLLTNLKQYEKQLETARANSKAEKERKDKEAKEAKERKEKCDKYRKKADEQTAAGKYADALTAADNIMTFKMAVRTIARRHGLHATFMPKPKFGVNGSGMHINMSLQKDGKNIFQDASDPNGLSEEAYYFIGGIMRHIKGMAAITNPLVNSYKRLVPGFEAPVYIAWSTTNRSPLIRIPAAADGEGTRIELRSPDSAANPYLTLAVCLSAGLEGIREKIEPPQSINANIFALSEKEREELHIDQLPGTLLEAVEELEKDTFIQKVLGDHIAGKYIDAKRKEWHEYRSQVSEWEIQEYLYKY